MFDIDLQPGEYVDLNMNAKDTKRILKASSNHITLCTDTVDHIKTTCESLKPINKQLR